MLCVTVYPNERLFIGASVVVVNCGRGKARIGVDAPPDVEIVRESAKVKVPNAKRAKSDGEDPHLWQPG